MESIKPVFKWLEKYDAPCEFWMNILMGVPVEINCKKHDMKIENWMHTILYGTYKTLVQWLSSVNLKEIDSDFWRQLAEESTSRSIDLFELTCRFNVKDFPWMELPCEDIYICEMNDGSKKFLLVSQTYKHHSQTYQLVLKSEDIVLQTEMLVCPDLFLATDIFVNPCNVKKIGMKTFFFVSGTVNLKRNKAEYYYPRDVKKRVVDLLIGNITVPLRSLMFHTIVDDVVDVCDHCRYITYLCKEFKVCKNKVISKRICDDCETRFHYAKRLNSAQTKNLSSTLDECLLYLKTHGNFFKAINN